MEVGMPINVNKYTVISNFLWRFLERVGAQGVTLIVSFILARILSPEVYGVVALLTVFTSILGVFIDSGLGNALIQKKDADDTDFSTVFFFNMFMCTCIFIILFLTAPLISKFYKNPEMTAPLRVMGIILLISGVKNIQVAYVSRNLQFRKFFFSTLGGTVTAAVVGIVMAVKGYGVWALVIQNLANNLIDTLILWITVKWRPKLLFSWSRLKSLFDFGWKLLASSLLDTIYSKLRQLVIGKMYSSEDLAFYNKGDMFPALVVSNINSAIGGVLFPVMSQEQNNKENLKKMTKKAITVCSYVIMPMMVGLAVCAEPIVRLILTDVWLPLLPFLRIFCFTYAFYPMATANLNAMQAMGRTDLFLLLEVLKKIVGIIALVSSMWFGVLAMAYSMLVATVIDLIINSWPNSKLLDYSFFEQLKDMLPSMVITLIMGAVVYLETKIPVHDLLKLIIQIPTGVVVYVLLSKITRIGSYDYIKDMLLNYLEKRKGKK